MDLVLMVSLGVGIAAGSASSQLLLDLRDPIPIVNNGALQSCPLQKALLQEMEGKDGLNGFSVVFNGKVVARWHHRESDGNRRLQKKQGGQTGSWVQQDDGSWKHTGTGQVWAAKDKIYKGNTLQHQLASVQKSYISVLVGMLYRDGFLDWEKEHPSKVRLGDIFPNETVWSKVTEVLTGGIHSKVEDLKNISLYDVLTMKLGGYMAGPVPNEEVSGLVQELDRLQPDTQTCCGRYSGTPINILSYVILEKAWDPVSYAQKTSATLPGGKMGLFEALGMESGSYTFEQDEDGRARGMWVTLDDMVKFGQLLVQGGKVRVDGAAQDIIPEYYFKEMTEKQADIMKGDKFAYSMGYIFAVGDDSSPSATVTTSKSFCAQGRGGQHICVHPNVNLTFAVQMSVPPLPQVLTHKYFAKANLESVRSLLSCESTSQEEFCASLDLGMDPICLLHADTTTIEDTTASPTTSAAKCVVMPCMFTVVSCALVLVHSMNKALMR